MQTVKYPPGAQWIWGLRGSDILASKSVFAMTLANNNKSYLIPPTWIVESANRNLFEYDSSKIYILKQNVQRQEGFLITNDRATISAAFENSNIPTMAQQWVVVQELLQNPLVVRGRDGIGRKINLRVYLFVMVDAKGATSMYMYGDGFIYYTADAWMPGSLERGPNITTGYIDRQVYVDNPLTIKDLYKHLENKNAGLLKRNLENAMRELAGIYKPIFAANNASYPGTKFLIYGCDVAPDSDFNVTFMEVNKGPDLSYKDERDRSLKLGMIKEMCNLVGILRAPGPRNFIKL